MNKPTPEWKHVLSDHLPDGPPVKPGTTLYAFDSRMGYWEYKLPPLPVGAQEL